MEKVRKRGRRGDVNEMVVAGDLYCVTDVHKESLLTVARRLIENLKLVYRKHIDRKPLSSSLLLFISIGLTFFKHDCYAVANDQDLSTFN